MKKMKGKKLDNRGSAMIVSIVVSVVVMAFCLSLLLVAYSLYVSTAKETKFEQCKDITESFSKYITDEITKPVYLDINEMFNDMDSKNVIWFYLRYNLLQANWPKYIRDDSTDEDENKAYRYIKINSSDKNNTFSKYASCLSVCFYYEDDYVSDDGKEENYTLHVIVSCNYGDTSYSVENIFNLNITDFEIPDNPSEEYNNKSAALEKGNGKYNPAGNTIDTSKKWIFTFDERK